MFPSVIYNIEAHRFTPHSDYIEIEGYDFTDATVAMEIRDRPNGGQLRKALTPTITVATEDGVPVSTVTWSVPEVDMEAMPTDPTDPSADYSIAYDVHLTPSGGTKFVPFRGKFKIIAGVTE